MLATHEHLVHSEGVTVVSHMQREKAEWIQHTVMIEDCDVPFKFRRVKSIVICKGKRSMSSITQRQKLWQVLK